LVGPKAITLVLREKGELLLGKAKVFKRYMGFLKFKVEKIRSTTYGDRQDPGVVVMLVLKAPTQIDGDTGEFVLIVTKQLMDDLKAALDESDALTAKLTGKREWGGKRPYTSPWLEHYM